jgi:virulence-associated protein VagC
MTSKGKNKIINPTRKPWANLSLLQAGKYSSSSSSAKRK